MNESLTPKELVEEGQAAYQRGDYTAAAQDFYAASKGYDALGDALTSAEMLNNCSVAHLKAGESEAALKVVEGTEEIFAKAGDLRRQGIALGNLGAALEALDRLEEALTAYEKSGDLLKEAGEKELRAHVMKSLSAIQLRTGRQMEAIATMQAGLDGLDRPSLKQRLLKVLLRTPFKILEKK